MTLRGTNDNNNNNKNNNNNNNNATSGGRGPGENQFSFYAVWGAQGQEKRRPKHKCCGKKRNIINIKKHKKSKPRHETG